MSVFDVVVDRQKRYLAVLFDKPLGQGKEGEVLDPGPAAIFPTLDPAKVILEGQVFTGETRFTVKTHLAAEDHLPLALEGRQVPRRGGDRRRGAGFNHPAQAEQA